MQNKLQELTDRLYNEGLSKGRREAEEMKAGARAEAAGIVADARKEAARIIADAEKEADEMKVRVANDIRMASKQTVDALKQQVENMIVTRAVAGPVGDGLGSVEFFKTLMLTVARAFRADNPEPVGLSAVLPAAMKDELEAFMNGEVTRVMGKSPEVEFTRQLSGGFKVGPAAEGYMVSFTDGDFERLFAEYLRPATKKLLFG